MKTILTLLGAAFLVAFVAPPADASDRCRKKSSRHTSHRPSNCYSSRPSYDYHRPRSSCYSSRPSYSYGYPSQGSCYRQSYPSYGYGNPGYGYGQPRYASPRPRYSGYPVSGYQDYRPYHGDTGYRPYGPSSYSGGMLRSPQFVYGGPSYVNGPISPHAGRGHPTPVAVYTFRYP
jgi:hypothetical protein